jgi:hypothetical protein
MTKVFPTARYTHPSGCVDQSVDHIKLAIEMFSDAGFDHRKAIDFLYDDYWSKSPMFNDRETYRAAKSYLPGLGVEWGKPTRAADGYQTK